MKKAFPFKKRLSAVLAVVLAVAAAAGTAPASAQDETYAYSVIGDYGNFEGTLWHFSDNSSEDTLSFNAEKQPVVTKGTKSTGSEATALSYRRVELAAGDYQLSFSLKASSQAYYIVSGYGFDSAGNAEPLKYEKTAEGSVGTEWTDVTANFTVNGSYPSVEFRIILRGAAGTQITAKDFDVKGFIEKSTPDSMVSANEPTLDGWEKYGHDTTPDYCNIELSDTSADDIGAVHFKKDFTQSTGTSLGISQMIKGASVEEGKTYTLELNVKGTFTGPHDKFYIGFPWTFATWTDTAGDNFAITSDYDNWTNLKYDFTVTRKADTPIKLWAGGYVSVDCYIDNIKVYAKDDNTKSNILNNGNFYKTNYSVENWNSIDSSNPNTEYCKLDISDEHADDAGSLHFKKDFTQSAGTSLGVSQMIKGASVEEGKTYTLELNVKGTFAGPHDKFYIGFPWTFATWADTAGNNFAITSDYDNWTNLKYDFTVTRKADTPIKLWVGGYVSVDCYIDNIKIYAKDDESKTNLIINGNFCKTEKVLINENLIKNDEVKLTDIPGIDMGMLRKEGASAAAVPGGSYDGSTALKVTADGLEGYFQTYGNESEIDFPDAVKRGKIAFVKGDTAIKASGYFKKLDTSDADAEPKVWFGFGKEYTVKKFLVSKTISSIGSHYNSESDRLDTEKYEDIGNGWVKFEMSLTDDMLASSELKTSLAEAERIRFMCGVDGYDSENKKKYFGEALFDDVKFEIISKYAPGDSNGDGAIDIRDLIHMKKYAAGTVKFTDMTRGTWLSNIGYNESPSITNEMVAMHKYLIGLSSEYGK